MMMKEELKKRHKKLLIEVELSPEGEMTVTTPGQDDAQGALDAKDEGAELQKSSDLAPMVKDSDEPGVIKDNETQEQAKFLEGMVDKMPRAAPMDQGSIQERAKRGMMDKLSSLKKV